MIALAIAILCLCPPLRTFPSSPKVVSYEWGSCSTKSCALAFTQLSLTSARFCALERFSSDVPCRPLATFERILSLKSTVSY